MDLGPDPRATEAAFEATELHRRLANVVRIGTVATVDHAAARVRVRYDTEADGTPILTDWLPWLTARAGADRSWWAPTEGEQVVVLAPGGELPQAVAVLALYRTLHGAPASDANLHRVEYSDGAVIEYDRGRHRLRAILPAGATAEVAATGGVTITGDVSVAGNVSASGQITDHSSSMQQMRDTYNAHASHPPGDM